MNGTSSPGPGVHQRYQDTATIVFCRDAPQGPARRAAATAAHLAYVEANLHEYNIAGPLYDATGRDTVGSIFSLRTKDLAHARRIIEGDPYFTAGVFASVEYFPHLPAAGRYIGGKVW
jgi:uncharacterized protein YciI